MFKQLEKLPWCSAHGLIEGANNCPICRPMHLSTDSAAQKPYINKEETTLEVRTNFGFAILCLYQISGLWLLVLV